MKNIFIYSLLIILTGCSAKVTYSGGKTVVVRSGAPDMGLENAFLLADQECLKQGKSAVVRSVTSPYSNEYIFECVEN